MKEAKATCTLYESQVVILKRTTRPLCIVNIKRLEAKYRQIASKTCGKQCSIRCANETLEWASESKRSNSH